MPNIRGPELLILVLIIVVLFGAKRLPDVARGLGRSLRIFKAETKGLVDADDADRDGTRQSDSPPPGPERGAGTALAPDPGPGPGEPDTAAPDATAPDATPRRPDDRSSRPDR